MVRSATALIGTLTETTVLCRATLLIIMHQVIFEFPELHDMI